jgi:glycosyltransferase involved in cell wall biosynthesis
MDVNKIKLHLSIRSLNHGGSERQFINLVKNIDLDKFDLSVSTMYGGDNECLISNIPSIQYFNLRKKGRYEILGFLNRYHDLLKRLNPDIVYSFKHEMNIFSYLCKPKKTKIILGFRTANLDLKKCDKLTCLMLWIEKKISYKSDGIIANSRAAIGHYRMRGYFIGKMTVISNGINTNKFKKINSERIKFRKKYNIRENDILIGMVARINHVKGYPVLAQAAYNLLKKYSNVHFFTIGSGNTSIKNECEVTLGNFNNDRFVWLGLQSCVENIYSGLDIVTSASFVEGFSNSIAEAMSCELPCVVTDVGDNDFIIGSTGILVNPGQVHELQHGLEILIKEYKNGKKYNKNRQRIIDNFSIIKMTRSTQSTIERIVRQN